MLNNFPLLDAISIFYAIIVESLPFVVLGLLVSGIISVFVSEDRFVRLIPKNLFLGHVAIAFLGFVFPVCECGNIPVARRLLAKGLPLSQVITFLLSAPIFNPIVIAATYTAFKFAPQVVFYRVFFCLVIAIAVGLTFSKRKSNEDMLTDNMVAECNMHHHVSRKNTKEVVKEIAQIIKKEVVLIFPSLVFGAAVAAVISTASRADVVGIATSPFLAIVAMMVLAFIMTVCSTVDAFIALGYVGLFPLNAIIVFLIFGPMIDLRVTTMLLTTFKSKLVFWLIFLVTAMVLVSGLIMHILGV